MALRPQKPLFDGAGQRIWVPRARATNTPKPPRDDPEHRLQRQAYETLNVCLPPGYKAFSTLNGVYLKPKTRQKASETGFRPGPLDLFIIGGQRTRWLEAKIHPNKMTAGQLDFVSHLHPSAWGLFYTLDEMVEIVTGRFGIELRGKIL